MYGAIPSHPGSPRDCQGHRIPIKTALNHDMVNSQHDIYDIIGVAIIILLLQRNLLATTDALLINTSHKKVGQPDIPVCGRLSSSPFV